MNMFDQQKYKYYSHEPAGCRKMRFIETVLGGEKKIRQQEDSLSILDIGCGMGHLSAFMAAMGNKVRAIDTDVVSVVKAKEIYGREPVVFANEELEKQVGQFDLITTFEVCEHIADLDVFLRQVSEKIKDEGLFVVSVPNGYSLEEIIRRFFQHTKTGKKLKMLFRKTRLLPKSDNQSCADSPHVIFWSFGRWKRAIEKQGFVLEKKKNVSFLFKQFYYLGGRRFLKKGKIFYLLNSIDGLIVSFLSRFLADGWLMVFRKKKI